MKVVRSAVGLRATRMVGALVVTASLALGSAAAAGAAPTGARSSGAGNFCTVSKSVAQYLVNLESQLRSASSPTRTKAVWGAIMSAEPSIKSSAPGSLKGDVNRVYVAATAINADLKKANWNVAGLLPYVSSLNAQMTRAKPSLNRLDNYWRGTCKFKF
jgi:hypothetical protein